jgi:hypothetical protein
VLVKNDDRILCDSSRVVSDVVVRAPRLPLVVVVVISKKRLPAVVVVLKRAQARGEDLRCEAVFFPNKRAPSSSPKFFFSFFAREAAKRDQEKVFITSRRS